MPTYEYKCSQCGGSLEVWQRFSDAPLTRCSMCGGNLRRVFSAVGVIFKGSGWYSTDSRPKSQSDSEGESKAPDLKPKSNGESKAPDLKPATSTA